MPPPRITIVTPSLNQGAYIGQTIESVLAQNYPNLEYFVIDGGSKDQSVSIIKKFEKHLDYWVSEPDRGQSHAINKGFLRATGEVVNWLNADDFLEPGALDILGSYFEDPATNVVAGRSNIVRDGAIVSTTLGTDVYPGNLAKTIGLARIDQPETYFRRSVVTRVGPLNDHFHYVMDREFWIRYLVLYGLSGIVKIPDVLTNFRQHPDSKTQMHKHRFEKETLNLFYQIAIANDLQSACEFLAAKSGGNITASINPVFRHHEPGLMASALNYFFLYQADSAYARHDHNACRSWLREVSKEHLPEQEAQLFDKLNFRSAFVPEWLQRLFHR